MDTKQLDNDTRGWIMCAVSGIACIAGASIICVDVFVRLIPSKRHFRIQDSNAFLACSLSLSFGVMIFSALYSMLPSASQYLAKDNWDAQKAGFLLMGCFVGGFFGIQVLSRLIHQYIPSHIVECDHTHDELPDEESAHGHHHHHKPSKPRQESLPKKSSTSMVEVHGGADEVTPLLLSNDARQHQNGHIHTEILNGQAEPQGEMVMHFSNPRSRPSTQTRRPSMLQAKSRVMSFFRDTKPNCDEDGPCFGYSDPCGQGCFKHVNSNRFTLSRHATIRSLPPAISEEMHGSRHSFTSPRQHISRAQSRESLHSHHHHHHDHGSHHHDEESDGSISECCSHTHEDAEAQHHHHVPTNAFLSIGLQTVIAITLHKFPEGFITYATNHVSSSLGFNVFMALFVHNIAEGFSMALPLYMALGSRWKAIAWSSLLGGLSQPMGAGVAMLWFKLANRQNLTINATAYACLFAVTAGIMTSVALQLFAESLSLNHNRNLSIFFAFLGMTMLGVSNAMVTH
ncbi:zinc-regulated transporter 3 [Podospora australis]|uniref:Zinc-regulated transporter 3 n=1 Tax=Podospora australis TaxID=1536484 RepID=A0AAN7ANN6_9PEZI|nr:zinc-regulated transporter 3 [Podospora australis]